MKILILGVNGGFGKLFHLLLLKEKMTVVGVDLQPEPEGEIPLEKYISCNLFSPNEAVMAEVATADVILVCLPEKVVYPLLPIILPVSKPGSLTVETTSVKSIIAEIIGKVSLSREILCINPMFAPDLGLKGNNMVAVRFNPAATTEWFALFAEKYGCRITWMTTEEHDLLTAVTQVATHAAIISFGFFLEKMNYQTDRNLPVATPPHLNLLALFARIKIANPEVYWKIQTDNPYGEMAREMLLESLGSFNEMIRTDDKQRFEKLMSRALQSDLHLPEKLAAECREIFAHRFKGLN
ncbi:MAG: prephenate dehydrogenase dimerization domain-containing protein [Bacteroidia bacterium]|nr:prephenate dehydrogenase dimerization domain-containing protein [Bacteroidia bacterium]